jgi:hypothetical protein
MKKTMFAVGSPFVLGKHQELPVVCKGGLKRVAPKKVSIIGHGARQWVGGSISTRKRSAKSLLSSTMYAAIMVRSTWLESLSLVFQMTHFKRWFVSFYCGKTFNLLPTRLTKLELQCLELVKKDEFLRDIDFVVLNPSV